MEKQRLRLVGVIVLSLAGVLLLRPPAQVDDVTPASGALPVRVRPENAVKMPESIPAMAPASTQTTQQTVTERTQGTERSPLLDNYGASELTPVQDVQLVLDVLHATYTNLKGATDYLSGTNAEVTAFLTGQNPEHLEFIPPDHPAVRGGELRDRWGAPVFFHFIGPGVVQIRSAGPDRKMWTADDIQFPAPDVTTFTR